MTNNRESLTRRQFVKATAAGSLALASCGRISYAQDAKPDANDAFGFIQGLRAGLEKPRGDQRWEVQAVQNLSQVFLGSNLKCATCHDSFIDLETWAKP